MREKKEKETVNQKTRKPKKNEVKDKDGAAKNVNKV